MIDYNSIPKLISAIKKEGFYLNKNRGQNFLIDRNIREFIVEYLDIKKSDVIWEIGGGFGSITSLLALKSDKLSVFELDKGFLSILKREFTNIKLIEGDFLKSYKLELLKNPPKFIFGNLSYNMSSKIILKLATENIDFESMIFMVQKELCDRMTAKHGDKNYSSFSVLTQILTKTKKIKDVSPDCFFPKPKIDSVLIEIKKNIDLEKNLNIKLLDKILRRAFLSRRKTIMNNFKASKYFSNLNMEEKLLKIGVNSGLRAERLTPKDFISLCILLQNLD